MSERMNSDPIPTDPETDELTLGDVDPPIESDLGPSESAPNPSAQNPLKPGPTASGPAASGPTASGPTGAAPVAAGAGGGEEYFS